ncbi:MAG TPA: peroxidase family protein, partial [Gemmataceae bacterium]|nr:peroxidase family protein [Gemmataceae bacterium]
MKRAWWNRVVIQKTRATKKRRNCWLRVEQLEVRCQPSVTGFRPIDEVGNNAANPTLGMAGTDLLRLSPAAYGDGLNTPSLADVAGPRLVSNVVDNQAAVLFGDPSTDVNTVDGNSLTDFGYVFGQFIDHDMDLTPTQSGTAPVPNPNQDGANGFPIPADPTNPTDPLSASEFDFSRSVFDPTTGITGPRQQINAITSYLDLSQVYGSTAYIADALRLHSGGLLKTSPGNLLPYDSLDYFNQDQINALNMANDSGVVTTDK